MSATTAERLTWDEICARYPDEWVLLADPDLDDWLDVSTAVLAFHTPDPVEAARRADVAPFRDQALLFTGQDPTGDFVYIL